MNRINKIVVIDGILTSYSESGRGPIVILLHGWGDSKSTFIALDNMLQKRYRILIIDLPGSGQSETPKEVFDLEKYASFVSSFVKKIGVSEVYAYIGHSNGGAIAIRGLSSGIMQSDKLVLLASSGVRSVYTGRKKFMRLAAKAAKIPTGLLPKSAQTKLKKKVYATIGSDMFVAEHLQETFKKVVSEDVVHEAAMITQPTLLLYGSLDRATPVVFGEKFAKQIESSELVVIQGADHFLHHTHASKVNRLVEKFLEKE